MVKVHERIHIVQRASAEIAIAVNDLSSRHGLTLVEKAQALTAELARVHKHMLREERHPGNPEARADEA